MMNKSLQQAVASQSGVTLLVALLILGTVMAISFSLATILLSEARNSGDLLRTEPALYGATAVSEQALFNTRRSTGAGLSTSLGHTQITTTSTTTQDAILTVKIPTTSSSFANTTNIYGFYDPSSPYGGSHYGRIVISYLNTNTPGTDLHIYLCQWDPQNPPTNADGTYKKVCTDQTDASYMVFMDTNPAPLSPSPNNVWDSNTCGCMNGLQQQELFLFQSTAPGFAPSDIYAQISTYDDSGNAKGIPYFGSTAVDIKSLNGTVIRSLRTVIPNP